MFNEEEFPGYAEVYRKIIKEGKRRNAEFITCRNLYLLEHDSVIQTENNISR